MAKNSIDAYKALGKTNLLQFDPDTLVLVVDPEHPLYDSRVHLPLREEMVLNIMHFGVIEPIVVAKNAETGETEVVAGRQRVKHAREANRRRRAMGLEALPVPAVIKGAKNKATLTGLMASENAHREEETPITRAEKMRRLADLNQTEEQIAMVFGVKPPTVRQSLALLECTAAVRNAVDSGRVPVTHALKLAKLDPETQRSKVAELVSAAATSTGHERARRQREVVDGQVKKMRSRREIAARLRESNGEFAAGLRWALGEEDPREAGEAT